MNHPTKKMDMAALQSRARDSYETGRWQRSFKVVPVLFALAALSVLSCSHHEHASVIGISLALIVLAVGFRQRGGALGRGVAPGVGYGAVASVAPFGLHMTHGCEFSALETTVCAIASFAIGCLILRKARHAGRSARGSVISAGIMAGLLSQLFCVDLGVGPMLAMASVLLAVIPGTLLTAQEA